MNQLAANEIVEKLETTALEIQTASIPVNSVDSEVQLSRAQLWQALKIWGRGDERFIPSFVKSRIVEDSGDAVIKDILHYGKSSMADGSPNLQRTSFRGDNLMITEYLAGPWFMAIAGIEERINGDLCFQLTTVRHKQHPEYVSPADAAKKAGADKPPPTTEQNARRVLGIILQLAENNEL
jgi:hypothetical protein